MEDLEQRRLLTAEGDLFAATASLDASGLVGNLTAVAEWGDGTQTAASITATPQRGPIRARIDYSLDNSNFFSSAVRRNLLQLAADTLVGAFRDTLTAITPGGGNTWTARLSHPATGAAHNITDLSIAQNEIVIFAGARNLPGSNLGLGGFGGFSTFGTPTFNNTVAGRGQAGALLGTPTDFGPWGGSITFDADASWYFGTDPAGLQSGQNDFLTVALHEISHLLGFGTAGSWARFVAGGRFTGPQSVAAYDGSGSVPLSSSSHWATDLTDEGRETLMDPNIQTGSRKTPTRLDLAGLDDLGWDLIVPSVEVSANHVYADNGLFPIALTVSGSAGGEVTKPLSASITNVAPTLTTVGDQTAVAGRVLSLSNLGLISDPGFRNNADNPPTAETFTYSVNWGDGSPVETGPATIDRNGSASIPTLASFDGQHTYAAPGVFTVSVGISDDDGGKANSQFRVTVGAVPSVSLDVTSGTFSESDPSGVSELIIRRQGTTAIPLNVTLTSDDTSEVTVPARVSFGIGETEKRVPLTPVDDTLLDGDVQVNIRASATGIDPTSVAVTVKDAESLFAEFDFDLIGEGAGVAAAELLVRRSNTDTASALDIAVTGIDASEIGLATPITIPAGQQETRVPIDVIDDTIQDGYQDIVLLLNAAGYPTTTAGITVADDEPSPYQNDTEPLDTDASGKVEPIDALRVINELNRSNGARRLVPGQDPTGSLFYDVNGDYLVTPIDALAIINYLNRLSPFGEAERNAPVRAVATDAALADWLPTPVDNDDDSRPRLLGNAE